jgi:hypothetical protein
VSNWLPPLIGEEPEELEDAEDEVTGDEEAGDEIEEDSEKTKSVEPPPSVVEARKTRAQMAKEKEAAKEESHSASASSSDAV